MKTHDRIHPKIISIPKPFLVVQTKNFARYVRFWQNYFDEFMGVLDSLVG